MSKAFESDKNANERLCLCGKLRIMAEEKSLDQLFAESELLRRETVELIQTSEKLMQKSDELQRQILDKLRPGSA